jgi:hypothetical protein
MLCSTCASACLIYHYFIIWLTLLKYVSFHQSHKVIYYHLYVCCYIHSSSLWIQYFKTHHP